MTDEAGLSRADSAKGRLQRAVLERLHVHEREGTLPTSTRFLFYELVQLGVVSKTNLGKKRLQSYGTSPASRRCVSASIVFCSGRPPHADDCRRGGRGHPHR